MSIFKDEDPNAWIFRAGRVFFSAGRFIEQEKVETAVSFNDYALAWFKAIEDGRQFMNW